MAMNTKIEFHSLGKLKATQVLTNIGSKLNRDSTNVLKFIYSDCDVIIYAIEWPTYPYECNAILYDVNCGEFNEYIRTGFWLGYT